MGAGPGGVRGDEKKLVAHRQAKLIRCERRIKKIVGAIAEGLPARALKAELEELEAKRERLEREVTRAPEPKPLLHPNLVELYRKKVAELETFLTGELDAAGWGAVMPVKAQAAARQ